jgi:NADPH:quinone reductase-like Zn-dependent oxidoreductase
MSASSNTSLFVIEALRKYDAQIFATTSSKRHVNRIDELGAKTFALQPRVSSSTVRKTMGQAEGFDAVIDPFSDLNLNLAVELLRPLGVYIMCGFYDQHPQMIGANGALGRRTLSIV